MNPRVRVSDAERREVIEGLTRHTAAGRLSLDEFAERVDAVNSSTTAGELVAVTADLPEPAQHRPAPAARPVVIVAAVLAVLLIAVVVALLLAGFASSGPMGHMGR